MSYEMRRVKLNKVTDTQLKIFTQEKSALEPEAIPQY